MTLAGESDFEAEVSVRQHLGVLLIQIPRRYSKAGHEFSSSRSVDMDRPVVYASF